jgi:hypothetical protein
MSDFFEDDDILDLPDPEPDLPQENGPGALPIAKNLTPREMVQSVLRVYQQLGAETWLLEQAKDNPREFLQIIKQMLPKDVGDIGTDQKINIIIQPAKDHETAPNRAEVIDLSGMNEIEPKNGSPENEAVNVRFLQ